MVEVEKLMKNGSLAECDCGTSNAMRLSKLGPTQKSRVLTNFGENGHVRQLSQPLTLAITSITFQQANVSKTSRVLIGALCAF